MNKVSQLIIVSIIFLIACFNILSAVRAAQLENNSIFLSDPRVNKSGTTYSIGTSGQSTALIRCFTIRFTLYRGIDSPIPGLDISSVSLSSSSNFIPTPASWSVSGSNITGVITITNPLGESPAGGINRSIVLEGITNGSVSGEAYWFEVDTFSDAGCSASVDTDADGEFLFNSGLLISSVVEETLDLSLSANSCSFGELSISSPKTCNIEATVASNAPNGYSLHYLPANTLTHTQGFDTISPSGQIATPSNSGIEQFGFNLVANTNPAVGVNPNGGSGAPATNYSLSNYFAFTPSGAQIANTVAPSYATTFTASFIANISSDTVAGDYTTTQTWLIIANP